MDQNLKKSETNLYETEFLSGVGNRRKFIKGLAGLFFAALYPETAKTQIYPRYEPRSYQVDEFAELMNNPRFRNDFDVQMSYQVSDMGMYEAHGLLNKTYDLGTSPQMHEFSIKSPWLVVNKMDRRIPTNRDVYVRVAFAASYLKMKDTGEARNLQSEAQRYRNAANTAVAPEFLLGITAPVTQTLFSLIPSAAGGKITSVEVGRETLEKVGDEVVREFSEYVRKSARSQRPFVPFGQRRSIDSEKVFKDAMYDMIRESASDLDNAARSMMWLGSTGSYRSAARISEDIIDGKTDAHAAIVALLAYYGRDEFEEIFNFFVNQVAEPGVAGFTGINIERFTDRYPEMQDAYLTDVAAMREINESAYGMRHVEPGVDYIMQRLNLYK